MNLKETLNNMSREEILARLNTDEDYYGDFGKQFLSNSDISKLIKNPEEFHKPQEQHLNLVLGAAFHTMVLEPEKMVNFDIVDSSSRYTKKYKEAAQGEIKLLKSEVEHLEALQEKLYGNSLLMGIMKGDNVEYEVPIYGEVCGEMWKGKADILNHDDRLIIDIKTTSDISKFASSAKRYNYDSQAFIYRSLFGYDMVFVVIDKKSKQLGFYDCSQNFYANGKEKVVEAVYAYRMFFKDQAKEEFNWSEYLITETL